MSSVIIKQTSATTEVVIRHHGPKKGKRAKYRPDRKSWKSSHNNQYR